MKPQNLLVIMADEHNPKMLGCSGHAMVRTPNLDGLAARGTRFSAAYTTCPICVPARASFATGQYVHQNGYWDNAIAYDGRVESWGHRLQAAGIRVESVGKRHYRQETDPTRHALRPQDRGAGLICTQLRRNATTSPKTAPTRIPYRGSSATSTPLSIPMTPTAVPRTLRKHWSRAVVDQMK